MIRTSLHLASAAALLALAACGETTSPTQQETKAEPEARALNASTAVNTWATRRSMPLPERSRMSAGTISNVIYVVGGEKQVEPFVLRRLDAYNVAANTWSVRERLPGARAGVNGASVIGGKLYVTGGIKLTCTGSCTTFATKTVFLYDPVSNTWARKADMPVEGSHGVQGVINGLLYVYMPNPGFGDFFRYNPATNTWSRRASPPIAHIHSVAGVINGKFYLVGGEGGADRFPTTTLNVYNPATNSWTTKAPMSTRRRDFFGGVINGKLYVAGGVTDTGEELKTTEVYDPATNTWTTKASMPSEQVGGASAVAGGKLFVIGGFSTLSVRAYTP